MTVVTIAARLLLGPLVAQTIKIWGIQDSLPITAWATVLVLDSHQWIEPARMTIAIMMTQGLLIRPREKKIKKSLSARLNSSTMQSSVRRLRLLRYRLNKPLCRMSLTIRTSHAKTVGSLIARVCRWICLWRRLLMTQLSLIGRWRTVETTVRSNKILVSL